MGWCGGTEIFDCVADELLELQKSFDVDLPMYKVMNVLSQLKSVLEDQDWDNACESNYWDHLKIGEVLGNDFEDDEE